MYRFFTLSLLTLLLGVDTNLLAQRDRAVIWVHGRNSSNAFWANYAAAFENDYRRLRSVNNSYTDNDVWAMKAGIEVLTPDPSSIAVGHSMGGNAITHAAINNGGRFGAIITVGSPIRGSLVANKARNGSVDRAFQRGANDLAAGPGGWINIVSGGAIADELLHQIKNSLREHIDHRDPASLQLEENSTYINDLTDDTPPVSRLAIWGNEHAPVLWRLAGTSIQNVGGVPMGWLGTFRTDENRMVTTVKNIQGIYLAYTIRYGAQALVAASTGFWGWIFAGWYAYRANQWRRGYNYLRKNAESDWNNLIGATRTEPRQYCYTYSASWYCPASSCWSTCYYRPAGQTCYTYTQYISESSDGFIHQSSQIGRGTHFDRGSDYFEREARGANHLEQNRHREVRNVLTRAFSGTGFDGHFDRQ